jgi:cobaltochelatase CobN
MLAQAAPQAPGVELNLYAAKSLDEDPDIFARAVRDMEQAEAVVLYRSSETVWVELEPHIKRLAMVKPLWSLSHDPSLWADSSLPMAAVRRAYDYVVLGGRENFANLIRYVADVSSGRDGSSVPVPASQPWEGFYHPLAFRPFFPALEDFQTWHGSYLAEKGLSAAPKVGLLFSRHYWVNENHAVEDAIIDALEAKGLAVIPVFSHGVKDANVGNKGSLAMVREAFMDESGRSRIEALVKLSTFFLGQERDQDDEDGAQASGGVELFTQLNVPVFQPVVASNRTVEEWRENPQGLGQEIAWSVAMPEFEGVIEPMFVGAVSRDGHTGTGADLESRVPVQERCARLAARVSRWVAMRRKPASERKVAFILNNNPCASVEASVGGAAKLDSLESVARVLSAMRAAGYEVEVPASGKELIENIMDRKAISEFRWTTVDEIVKKGGALELLPLKVYQKWWDDFPEKVRSRVVESWGQPPGEHLHGVPPSMVYEGKIVISGVRYGNAVVLVQPKRGCAGPRCDGQVCKILHDPEIPPPHQYLATYRWLSERFGADCVVHVGTHGNVEFLPGKNMGLSHECLPDVCLHETPHLYIYNCDNPPEGTIAKRRSYATLVDHMQTAMTHGGLYDSLEELDALLDQYEQAKTQDKARAHALEHLILGAVRQANLDKDLGLDPTKTDHDQDFPEIVRKTHEALSTVRNTLIADGMHIFGDIPAGDRRADLIYSIVRHDGGEDHTLRKTLARLMGLELKTLLANQGEMNPLHGASHGRLLEELDLMGKTLVAGVLESPQAMGNGGFTGLARKLLAGRMRDDSHLPRLNPIRDRIAGINARVEASREIESLLNGFSGGHIPAGPSGVLTRGREDILPTGRNFYSLDPRRVPTKAAAMVGRSLAEALIAKHIKEEGRYPENVAVFWMANDIMWADGEGMGQIMNLIGVRPVWTSGRVEGLEIVSVAELGRPRVDVTIRVSGLIRDNFPDRMELLDQAIAAVAELDEPEDMNFVRKHALEKLRAEGQDPGDREAMRRATLRIFTSKPGTYQPGVNLAIYASAWKTQEDLSDIFLHWNGYAYGKDFYGQKAVKELASSLASVEVTYNKVVSDEHDLLGCCCYFGTHGGMTAAARQLSGKAVKSYYGDTREPEKVEMRDLAGEVRRVVRTKLLHPKWIEGMKRHGYKGAGDISKRVGRVYGWEASTGEVDDWIFDDIAKTFVLDDENRAFFEENNPWALEEIGRRLLEAANRGLWQADPEMLDELKERLLEIEGWLEERMGEVSGEFQGSSVDILTAQDVDRWKAALDEMKNELKSGRS